MKDSSIIGPGYAESLNDRAQEAKNKLKLGGEAAVDARLELLKLQYEAYNSKEIREQAEQENRDIDEKNIGKTS